MDVKDSNGTLLAEGDSVILIKDLKMKGSSLTPKRWTMVKTSTSSIALERFKAEPEAAQWC